MTRSSSPALVRYGFADSSIGMVVVAADADGVCDVALGDDSAALLEYLTERNPRASLVEGDAEVEAWASRVAALIDEPSAATDLPAEPRGTEFQLLVWNALRDIPVGRTASYTEIAERIGRPSSVRAVARACASNRLGVIVPCHRVVRADGDLSGYRWGTERKRALLDRESASGS